ncbi:MAG: FadR/GntR family transcriptional regulator [Propioniciclava sp.]
MTERRIVPVQRLTLAESVAEQLEQLIKTGDLAPGAQLPNERQLSQDFGVGRSSMREALRLIQTRGLVRIEHGKGVFVTDLDERTRLSSMLVLDGVTVADLFEVRRIIEGESAALAAERTTDADTATLRDIFARSDQEGVSDEEFIKLDLELHRQVVATSHNPLLVDVFESVVVPRFIGYSERVITILGRRKTAHAGHAQIVEAVLAGTPMRAREAAIDHIVQVAADIEAEAPN